MRKNSPNIAYSRPEFTDLNQRWSVIRDVLAGEVVIKRKGDAYLPRPNASDKSTENLLRYEQYKLRAVFYNATARTLQGLIGQVMGTDPEKDIPAPIDALVDDVDGAGNTLDQQAVKALSHTVAYGRAGLFIDYPRTEGQTTVAKLRSDNIRPTITIIDPWDIINWRTRVIGGAICLSMVVISEMYVTDDDGFEQKWDPQWRVLSLDENNIYTITEWIRHPENDEEFIIKGMLTGEPAIFQPTDASGNFFERIPFVFIGANSNDSQPDLPPLYDLASLNLAHYRNSADYEESAYMTGQPTPFFSGLTDTWVKDVMKGEVQLGARAAVLLPEGGAAGLLQASPNSMPKEAMESKENQMKALGAKLVEQKAVQRTATEAGQDKAAENSVLATVANNVSRAYEAALAFAFQYMQAGEAPEVKYQLNTSFTATAMDAQSRAQLVAEWQAGAITDDEMRGALTRAGIATLDLEEWRQSREENILNGNIVTPGQQLEAQTAAKQAAADAKAGNSDAPAK